MSAICTADSRLSVSIFPKRNVRKTSPAGSLQKKRFHDKRESGYEKAAARTTLKPLSPEERTMAEKNHHLVLSFLRTHGLPMEEYYDVVIFRYLLAVEKWFRRPDLYRYQFSTIAWSAMSSALYHEREKQKRRIPTVSLDENIPGCENLTWNAVVTEKNLAYTSYIG